MMHYTKNCQKGAFETELFDCCSDIKLCCYVTFCYEFALGEAWAVSRGDKCQCSHMKGNEIFIRSNIRRVRGMPDQLCKDNCQNMFCPICTLVQDIRELKLIQTEILDVKPVLDNNFDYYDRDTDRQSEKKYLEQNL